MHALNQLFHIIFYHCSGGRSTFELRCFSFLCYNPVPCDLWRNKLFCCASAICLRLRGRMCGNLDQILGTRIRQSLRVFLLSVDKCPNLGCPSLEVPTSLCTTQAASRKVVASCPVSCSLSLAPDMCSHVLVVLQAGSEVNHWPCLLGESQTQPHTTAQQQEPHPCPIQGRLVGAQSCLQGHKHHSHQSDLTEML